MSINPGATTRLAASMTRSALSGSRGATATIRSPAIATSALSRTEPEPSITVPFLISSDQAIVALSLYAAGPRPGIGLREMRVHHAPVAAFLVEDHGRPRDEPVALVVNFARRPILADPVPVRIAVTPDHRHLVRDHPADVERRPVRPLHILLVERPQATPVIAAVVSVAVEIEECGLGQLAPDWIEPLPVEVLVRHDVFVKHLQELFPIAFGAANQVCLAHSMVSLADLTFALWTRTAERQRFLSARPRYAISVIGSAPTNVSTSSETPARP